MLVRGGPGESGVSEIVVHWRVRMASRQPSRPSASGFTPGPGKHGVALAVLILLLLGGCRGERPTERPRAPGFSRGDRVVVEVRAGEFVEGTVTGVDGVRIRVQAAEGGEILEVGEADALPVGAPARAGERGAYAVCGRGGARWAGCRVVEVATDPLTVEFSDGERQPLPASSVLVPGELTRLNLERVFTRAAARAAFDRSVRAAGAPPIDPDWRPRPDERILVRRGTDWVTGQVQELERDGVYVRPVGDVRPLRLAYTETRPLPPYPVAPWVGGFVLVRPAAEARAWETLRVTAFGEDETAALVDDRGDRTTRPLRDLVPIGVPPAPPGPDAALQ